MSYLERLNEVAFKKLIDEVTQEYERRELQEEAEDEEAIYSHHITHFTEAALDIAKNPYRIRGIATGYQKLDTYLCGLGPGELTAIAADTSVGKTLFTLNLLNHAYKVKPGSFSTLYISLDTAIVNVCARFYSMWGFDDGNPIYFYNNTIGVSFDKVKKAIVDRQKQSGLDIVVVDMLNSLVRSVANQTNEMASVTLKLRELALELNVHIIILCHVTKEASKGQSKMHYSMIKDSSAVAQDSDIVIMLTRDNFDELTRDIMEVSVQKNRNKGRTGDLEMKVDFKTLTMFEITNETTGYS